MAHIIFNIGAGLLGFILLPLFLMAARHFAGSGEGAMGISPVALAAFHTSFTLLAAAIVLPATSRYARLVVRLVRERGPMLTRRLDPTVRNVPEVAVEAARLTLLDVSSALLGAARLVLEESGGSPARAQVQAAEGALAELREFLTGVGMSAQSATSHRELVSSLHAMDHLSRLVGVLRQHPRLHGDGELERARHQLEQLLELARAWLAGEHGPLPEQISTLSQGLAEMRRRQRVHMLRQTAEGHAGPGEALVRLDAMRWLDRIGYHAWRILHHLQRPAPEAPEDVEPPEPL